LQFRLLRVPTAAVVAEAAVHSYAVAYWWGAGIFAFGAVLAALLFKRRGQAQPLPTPLVTAVTENRPAAVH
jgi:membrane protein implicated in regulation of membrane protease activity